MISQATAKIRYYVITYWLEAVAWGFLIVYMSYIWVYYSWQAFWINVGFGIVGFMATYWFGHLMPIVGYFVRKWDDRSNNR